MPVVVLRDWARAYEGGTKASQFGTAKVEVPRVIEPSPSPWQHRHRKFSGKWSVSGESQSLPSAQVPPIKTPSVHPVKAPPPSVEVMVQVSYVPMPEAPAASEMRARMRRAMMYFNLRVH